MRISSVPYFNHLREIDVAALTAAILSIALGVASSHALNADGVSYLDLASAVRDGDWARFVQGYWSPLYPLLLAAVGAFAPGDVASLLAVTHALNVLIALVGIALIWARFRPLQSPLPARLALSAWLLCSARPPRVDALTPDLLLTVLILAMALELIGDRRPFRLGVVLGAIFLAKSSSWPWIIVVLVLHAWRSRERLAALRTTALTCAAVMLLWIVPLSVKMGAPTVETASALNACWYLRACDSRTPDTHAGEHRDYRQTIVEDKTLLWAAFDSTRWTYAPWSDPTAWAAGVRTKSELTPTVGSLLSYWGRLLGTGLRFWLWPMILGVMLPALLIRRWSVGGRDLAAHDRSAIAVTVAGALGVGQFFLIHAEPRLIGPYLLCLAVGTIAICVPPSDPTAEPARVKKARGWSGSRRVIALSYAGYLIAIPLAVMSLRDAFNQRRDLNNRERAIGGLLAPLRESKIDRPRIVLIGYALPVLSDAWRANARIVAQVRPSSALQLSKLPAAEAQRISAIAFAHSADVLWFAGADGSIRMAPVIR
ncbi:MAG: hypothetical protein ABI877_20055 [Gemmatimonadaceae bacterium]